MMGMLADLMDNSSYLDQNSTISTNDSQNEFKNPLHTPAVRTLFIILYVFVFLACVLGNSLVLYTIIRNKRLRTRTNFFLANLAVADLGVGLICVLPTLQKFLSPIWSLGEAMCKIYYFAHSMTYTASILLLTAIAIERYIAIIHPLRSRNLVTQTRLIFAQVCIWLLSAGYNSPDLVMFGTIVVSIPSTTNGTAGETKAFCYLVARHNYMKEYYTVNFVLWYAMPLSIMTFMYARVAYALWNSSKLSNDTVEMNRLPSRQHAERLDTVVKYESSVCGVKRGVTLQQSSDFFTRKSSTSNNNTTLATHLCNGEDETSYNLDATVLPNIHAARQEQKEKRESFTSPSTNGIRRYSSSKHQSHSNGFTKRYLSCDFSSDISEVTSSEEGDTTSNTMPKRIRVQYRLNSERVLTSRRRVIRLLVVVLLTFAICVFPHHLRQLLIYWESYTNEIELISPVAFLLLYSNSAANPFLYWLFSDAFRRSFKDTCQRQCCCCCCYFYR